MPRDKHVKKASRREAPPEPHQKKVEAEPAKTHHKRKHRHHREREETSSDEQESSESEEEAPRKKQRKEKKHQHRREETSEEEEESASESSSDDEEHVEPVRKVTRPKKEETKKKHKKPAAAAASSVVGKSDDGFSLFAIARKGQRKVDPRVRRRRTEKTIALSIAGNAVLPKLAEVPSSLALDFSKCVLRQTHPLATHKVTRTDKEGNVKTIDAMDHRIKPTASDAIMEGLMHECQMRVLPLAGNLKLEQKKWHKLSDEREIKGAKTAEELKEEARVHQQIDERAILQVIQSLYGDRPEIYEPFCELYAVMTLMQQKAEEERKEKDKDGIELRRLVAKKTKLLDKQKELKKVKEELSELETYELLQTSYEIKKLRKPRLAQQIETRRQWLASAEMKLGSLGDELEDWKEKRDTLLNKTLPALCEERDQAEANSKALHKVATDLLEERKAVRKTHGVDEDDIKKANNEWEKACKLRANADKELKKLRHKVSRDKKELEKLNTRIDEFPTTKKTLKENAKKHMESIQLGEEELKKLSVEIAELDVARKKQKRALKAE